MKKLERMKKFVIAAVVMAAAVVNANVITDKAVGAAVKGGVKHGIAVNTAKQMAKAGIKSKIGSMALAGVKGYTAKKILATGAAIGTMVAMPVVAHEISDGYQEMNLARAKTIEKTGDAAAKVIENNPDKAAEVMGAVDPRDSIMDKTEKAMNIIVTWVFVAVGIILFLHLFGLVMRSAAFAKSGITAFRKKSPFVETVRITPENLATSEENSLAIPESKS